VKNKHINIFRVASRKKFTLSVTLNPSLVILREQGDRRISFRVSSVKSLWREILRFAQNDRKELRMTVKEIRMTRILMRAEALIYPYNFEI